jgi:hypothetical protein
MPRLPSFAMKKRKPDGMPNERERRERLGNNAREKHVRMTRYTSTDRLRGTPRETTAQRSFIVDHDGRDYRLARCPLKPPLLFYAQ